MRVTESMIYNTANSSLANDLAAIQAITEKVSSAKQLNRPSDNPADVRSAVGLRDTLAQLNQYVRNIDTASEQGLGHGHGPVQRRRTDPARQRAGHRGRQRNARRRRSARRSRPEVAQLTEAMAQDASAKVGDEYIFSGFRVDRAPYQVTGPGQVGAYQGDHGVSVARVGPASTMQVSMRRRRRLPAGHRRPDPAPGRSQRRPAGPAVDHQRRSRGALDTDRRRPRPRSAPGRTGSTMPRRRSRRSSPATRPC